MKDLFANIAVQRFYHWNIQVVIIVISVYVQSMQIKIHGDRLEVCKGKLVPISVQNNPKKGYVIIYKCDKCGAIRKNIAAKDDNMNLIIKLSANPFVE